VAAGDGAVVGSALGDAGTAVGAASVGGASVARALVESPALESAPKVDSGMTTRVVDDEVARADAACAWPLVNAALAVTTNAVAATMASRARVARPEMLRVKRI
jgi:hypothetical protein